MDWINTILGTLIAITVAAFFITALSQLFLSVKRVINKKPLKNTTDQSAYSDKLGSPKWKVRREMILKRMIMI